MKHTKRYFNELLRQYNKYTKKLTALKLRGKNARKQGILTKRIATLFQKLTNLKEAIRLTTATAAVAVGIAMALPNGAQAQNFLAPQVSPFGLDTTSGNSAPAFADLDGDGDQDMLSGVSYGDFAYYENTGSPSAPSFGAVQVNPFGLANTGSGNPTPTFVDIDNDGDMDMFAGENRYANNGGRFYYYENTGSSTAPTFAAAVTNPFSLAIVPGYYYSGYYGTYISGSSAPSFVDFDGDGDMDLMSGSYYGDIYYYENTGTVTAADFSTAPVQNPNNLTGVGNNYSTPSFGDLDGDGDMDLIAGVQSSNFVYFQDTSVSVAPHTPNFDAPQTNPFNLVNTNTVGGGGYSTPALVDLDNDGDLDLMSGEGYGKFFYFKNCTPNSDSVGVVSCDSAYTSPSGNYVWTTAGVYKDTVMNMGGCDSLITINLSFSNLFNTVTQTGVNLFAYDSSATYQWIDCGNGNAPITGATSQGYTATANGSYAVVLTENGCSDTSACYTVSTVGIAENKLNSFNVYPNPVSNELKIQGAAVFTKVEVYNLTGQLLQTVAPNSNAVVLNMEQFEEGVYLVKMHTINGEQFTSRIVKK